MQLHNNSGLNVEQVHYQPDRKECTWLAEISQQANYEILCLFLNLSRRGIYPNQYMMPLPKKIVSGLTLSFVTIFLSSCANNNDFNSITALSAPEIIEYIETEEDNVQLETNESEICLEEELLALSKQGGWERDAITPVVATTKTATAETIEASQELKFDFPVVHNKMVETYLNIYQTRQRDQLQRWLAKSTVYKAIMEKELKEAGLPLDLVYLAMIESGYNQLACSRSKAIGLWQFMKATGRQYNLRVDKYVDERRDPVKSTKAAVTYLGDLYHEFGDWHLAVAAYNGGPGKVRSGLRKHNTNDFWELASKKHLRLETKHYVPKLIAALMIAKEPEKYGFSNIKYQKPLAYETLTVGPGMSLDAIALISDSTKKQIKKLNLELKKSKTPLNKARYAVKIPKNKLLLAKKNLSRLHSIVSTGYKTHKIAKGDTLSKICKRYRINKTTLLKVNNLHSGKLAKGRNLRIPYSTITYKLLPEGSSGAMAAYKDSLVLHRIKKGDTISKIAKRYKVPAKMIVAWNGLKNSHSIRAGHQLALYIDRGGQKSQKPNTVAATNQKGSKHGVKLIVSRPHKLMINSSEQGSPFQWYSVKNGDSLWTISRKFSASTADIKKWNNLKSNLIHPGSKLKLKKV